MTNATQEEQRTAVELFQTGDKGIIHGLARRLGLLLSKESGCPWMDKSTRHLTLQEFQDNFEWDESYSVEAQWEVFVEDYTRTFDCPSKEDALAWVDGKNQLEEPDWSDYCPGFMSSGDGVCSLVIQVKNLRLKPQQPKQKTWKLFFEVLADSDLEDHDLDQFCGDVGRFAKQRGEAIKVLATDFSEGDSLSTTRSEVVGQD